MNTWKPRSLEDKLLYKYWLEVGGLLCLEVPIGSPGGSGNWPSGSKTRRIDGVLLKNQEWEIVRFRDRETEFLEAIQTQTIELIEVKKKLNRLVIGQVIAGVDMFERQYQAGKIKPVILCTEGDPALEWVCEKRGIEVIRLNE